MKLEYPDMRKMIRCDFGPLEDVCCIFVHRMNVVYIRDGYMRIPKKTVHLVGSKTGHMDESGSILLHDDTEPMPAASFKKADDGRPVIQGGFRKYFLRPKKLVPNLSLKWMYLALTWC